MKYLFGNWKIVYVLMMLKKKINKINYWVRLKLFEWELFYFLNINDNVEFERSIEGRMNGMLERKVLSCKFL